MPGTRSPVTGRPTTALIDRSALRENLKTVRKYAPAAKVMSIIKANGYGHGIQRVANELQNSDAFGVASLDEALVLRNAGITQSIVLLEGFFSGDELPTVCEYELTLVIHHETQIEQLEKTPPAQPITVWLKIDTGMHRLGIHPQQFDSAYRRLMACKNIAAIHFMTHFSSADERYNPQTSHQTNVFRDVVQNLQGDSSLANSAAILHWPESHTPWDTGSQWVRPGIMLYGVSPFAEEEGHGLGLQPVMTLTSRLIAVNAFRQGDAIGYGAEWRCPEDMNIGVVAAGYGDGYPRSAASGTPVLIKGQRMPLIGRVSMDMLCVDLRQYSDARIGDEVVLWGRGLAVEEIARNAGTIAYELLCGVTSRVKIVETG